METHNSHPKKKCRHIKEGYVDLPLKYCPDCDIVYCELCGEEWKKEKIWGTWNNGTTWAGYENIHTINCENKTN